MHLSVVCHKRYRLLDHDWDVPMGTAKLQGVLRFCMGSHMLLIEQGHHAHVRQHRRVKSCHVRHTGAIERYWLLEWSVLAHARASFSHCVMHRCRDQGFMVEEPASVQQVHHSMP